MQPGWMPAPDGERGSLVARRMRHVLVGLSLALAMGVAAACNPVAAPAVPRSWQRGASIYPFSSGELTTPASLASLRQLRSLGANYVTLVVPRSTKALCTPQR